MKRLSDYQGEDAIELWGDLLEPFAEIISDRSVAEALQSGKPVFSIAGKILKNHKAQAKQILERIDDTPVNGINMVLRLMALLSELGSNEDFTSFFGLQGQGQTQSESTGSATENTEDGET